MREWKRLRREGATDFRIFGVRQEQVLNPRNQAELSISLLECPDWVNVIPVTRDGYVVLVRQFRFGIWSRSLEIPGGVIEPGESPADAAARELEEETGFRPGRMESLGFVHPNPAFQTNRQHHFIALDCEKAHQGRLDEGEDIEVELCKREEIDDKIRAGEISHALCLTAFLLDRLREA